MFVKRTGGEAMFQGRLALVGCTAAWIEPLLSRSQGDAGGPRIFADGGELLTDRHAFGFDFYVATMRMEGMTALDLLRIVRQRTDVGFILLADNPDIVMLRQAVDAGADMFITENLGGDSLQVCIDAVHRRILHTCGPGRRWLLDRNSRRLFSPFGVEVDLTEIDISLLARLESARGEIVSRNDLCISLGRAGSAGAMARLNAMVFRLRRRIWQATGMAAPLQGIHQSGYRLTVGLQIV